MRIVFDTNILVRANIKAQGPAREALLKIISGNHVLITSPFLLRELERALAYPRLQKLWRLSLQDIQEHMRFWSRSPSSCTRSLACPLSLKIRTMTP